MKNPASKLRKTTLRLIKKKKRKREKKEKEKEERKEGRERKKEKKRMFSGLYELQKLRSLLQ